MIDRVKLTNFQAHESYDLPLSKVTTIVGDSDRGKSAIIRAIVWAMTNKPGGSGFVKHGTSSAEVELVVDGNVITRKKGKSTNEYSLNGESFKAFGSSVPQPITEVLNVADDSISMQMDAPFWLSSTGSQLAAQLNEITGISVLSQMQHRASSEVRSSSQSVKVYEDKVSTCEKHLAALEGLDDLSEQAECLSCTHQQITLEHKRLKIAKPAVELLDQADAKSRGLIDLGPATKRLNSLWEEQAELNRLEGIVLTLLKHIDNHSRLQEDLAQLQQQLDSIKECPTCHRPL